MRARLSGAPRGTSFKWRGAGIAASWAYLFVARGDVPLVIAGRPISEREKLLGASGVSVAVIFFLTSVGSVLFSAVCIGLAGACDVTARCAGGGWQRQRLPRVRRSTNEACSRPARAGVTAHGALRVPDDLFLDDANVRAAPPRVAFRSLR